MVRLVNIKRTSEFIETEYIPEDSNEKGYVKMRLNDGEVVERKLTSLERYTHCYFIHTCNCLEEIKDDENLPEQRLVMWY